MPTVMTSPSTSLDAALPQLPHRGEARSANPGAFGRALAEASTGREQPSKKAHADSPRGGDAATRAKELADEAEDRDPAIGARPSVSPASVPLGPPGLSRTMRHLAASGTHSDRADAPEGIPPLAPTDALAMPLPPVGTPSLAVELQPTSVVDTDAMALDTQADSTVVTTPLLATHNEAGPIIATTLGAAPDASAKVATAGLDTPAGTPAAGTATIAAPEASARVALAGLDAPVEASAASTATIAAPALTASPRPAWPPAALESKADTGAADKPVASATPMSTDGATAPAPTPDLAASGRPQPRPDSGVSAGSAQARTDPLAGDSQGRDGSAPAPLLGQASGPREAPAPAVTLPGWQHTAATAGPTSAHAPSTPSELVEAQLPARPGSPEFAPALGAQLSILARRGVGEARLQLNPAEMGPISVQITLNGQQALVNLAAEHAFTRQVLEQSMPSLASALREAGMTLTGGGVFEQPPHARPPQDDGARPGRAPGGSVADEGPAVEPGARSATRAPRGVVDLYA